MFFACGFRVFDFCFWGLGFCFFACGFRVFDFCFWVYGFCFLLVGLVLLIFAFGFRVFDFCFWFRVFDFCFWVACVLRFVLCFCLRTARVVDGFLFQGAIQKQASSKILLLID